MSDPRLGRRRTGHAVTRTAEVLSVLTPVEDQDLQLLAEVGPCDAVQEEVDAVVHVEDDARDHQHALVVVEVLAQITARARLLMHVFPGHQEPLTPHEAVGQVEDDEDEGDDEEDDGELHADDALLRDDGALPVALVAAKQFADDEGVEDRDDEEGDHGDGQPVDAVQHEGQHGPSGVRKAAMDHGVRRLDLARVRQDGLEEHNDQREHHEREEHLLGRPASETELSPERVAHTDVALHGEGNDEPG